MTKGLETFPRSALADCGALAGARLWAKLFTGTLVIVIVASFFTPWTQTAPGDGRVIAFAPTERETPLRAPIDGQVAKWHVVEGQRVRAGDPIVDLRDNDPRLLERLSDTKTAVESQAQAVRLAVEIADEQLDALRDARDAAIAQAELGVRIARDRLDGVRQQQIAAEAAARTASINLTRQQRLNSQDLSSDRELELAELASATTASELDQARASLRAAEREVQAAQAELDETREKHRATIEKARSEVEKLRGEVSQIDVSRNQAETQLARQQQMRLTAPADGRVMSINARQGSDYVKTGDMLAVLVPDTSNRAVELWVDGNDAPLIGEGRQVRLQFEGWPAVQFVGWPSVAVGTFGGEVSFVDPAARADGKFRVVVVPIEGEAWPEPQYLRQGVRARGWVLLNRVSVAFEIWRQLNGFPPATERPPDSRAGSALPEIAKP